MTTTATESTDTEALNTKTQRRLKRELGSLRKEIKKARAEVSNRDALLDAAEHALRQATAAHAEGTGPAKDVVDAQGVRDLEHDMMDRASTKLQGLLAELADVDADITLTDQVSSLCDLATRSQEARERYDAAYERLAGALLHITNEMAEASEALSDCVVEYQTAITYGIPVAVTSASPRLSGVDTDAVRSKAGEVIARAVEAGADLSAVLSQHGQKHEWKGTVTAPLQNFGNAGDAAELLCRAAVQERRAQRQRASVTMDSPPMVVVRGQDEVTIPNPVR